MMVAILIASETEAAFKACKLGCSEWSSHYYREDGMKQKQLEIGCFMVECKKFVQTDETWNIEMKAWRGELQTIAAKLYSSTE